MRLASARYSDMLNSGSDCTYFKVTIIPCGSEDLNEVTEEPYELILSRSNTSQQNLKDILVMNQPVWQKVFGK
jgi:hypothetical protein